MKGTPSEEPSFTSPLLLFLAMLERRLWALPLGRRNSPRGLALRTARVAIGSLREFFVDECPLRASALTFVTVLSLVPLLAFAFSVAKGLGAYDYLVRSSIIPFLDRTFGAASASPSGELRHALDKVLDLVDHTNVQVLGPLGLALLLWSVLKVLGSVETAINRIFDVERNRSWSRKFSDYPSIVILAPIALMTASALTTAANSSTLVDSVEQALGIGGLVNWILELAPLVVVWCGFTFVYLVFPNTETRLSSALLGGLVGGSAWQLAQVLHVRFQVGIASYSPVYAGFAAIPIFLVWIYFSWCTMLLGAELAATHQRRDGGARRPRAVEVSHATLESLGVHAMVAIASAFEQSRGAVSSAELAHAIGAEESRLGPLLERLAARGLLVQTADQAWSLARPAQSIAVAEVLGVLRGAPAVPAAEGAARAARVELLLQSMQEDRVRSSANRTLAELVGEERDAAQAPDPAARLRPAHG